MSLNVNTIALVAPATLATGAALMTTLATGFGPTPPMTVTAVG
mgnify:CR=1 FL=1